MPGDQSDWNLEHMLVSIAGLCPEIPRSAAISWEFIPELIEAGTGANLWAEWAKLRGSIVTGSSYSAPEVRHEHAGLPVFLARQEWPDTSVFSDSEVVWKPAKRHHVALVVSSPDDRRVAELIDSYTEIVRKDFHATVPPREKLAVNPFRDNNFMMVGC